MEITREDIDGGRTVRLKPRGALDVDHAEKLHAEFEHLCAQSGVEQVVVDFSEVRELDSAGIAVISLGSYRLGEVGRQLHTENLSDEQRDALDLMPQFTGELAEKYVPTFFESVGELGLNGWHELKHYYDTFTDAVFAFVDMFKGRFPPKNSVTEQSVAIGVDAFPIIGLLSLLLGLIMAFQSAYQLRQFGANIYVANLVVISMVREFGPMMTGIMLAGRSGSAIAAELATMKVQEEIDALQTMGINPSRYLILPRMIAITIVTPSLALMSDIIGVSGGFLIGTLYLDLSADSYINQTLISVTLGDVMHGLLKSVVFAWIIGTIACYAGMNVRGGASGVGRATTRAVVASIFMIIVADSIFTTVSTLMGG
ncbi:MlaE family lipid ABC transporter permease subunit [Persicimonas caeni]|uniref:MlaE family lipid ABC transporter permease subunit n=1 Tax=Persicimonas caeni TaxID=2292766 RepID=A0A4Y6PU43_PERCE|nr:MlaE family lipid ABC transporter permease subunit [Persicimonas caeni]QDG51846.1 MlaE family lipid ABC transporter permease subunit [Persicimonas caeni]QED33067.1 MlaE family lipid ABC transporter permease subunit [Persicimonas caeni]